MTAHVQIITSPAGEELVVLPKKDYATLVALRDEAEEDAADVAAFDAAMAELPEQTREMKRDSLIAAFIRQRRKSLGLTQTELATTTGLGQGFVSDVESGRRRASSETLAKLAEALAFDLDAVLADPGETPAEAIERRLAAVEKAVRLTLPMEQGGDLTVEYFTLKPNASVPSQVFDRIPSLAIQCGGTITYNPEKKTFVVGASTSSNAHAVVTLFEELLKEAGVKFSQSTNHIATG